MRGRDGLVRLTLVVLLAAGCVSEAPSWARAATSRYGAPVALPLPSATGPLSVEQAIAERRSTPPTRSEPLSLATLGQLLWAGQGITGPSGKRAVPSAGALYPLELYVVTPTEVMHYLPEGHRVESRPSPDLRPALEAAAFGQSVIRNVPNLLVVAAAPDRSRRKYGPRGDVFVGQEAGHAAQNLLLEATSLGLTAVPIGGLDPHRASLALALPPDQTVLYLILIGPA
jgi:SagB-type dehydrogenase family enzyme